MSDFLYGHLVLTDSDGTVVTKKIKYYNTYNDMIADKDPAPMSIVKANATIYYYKNGQWEVGLPYTEESEDCTSFKVYANAEPIPVGNHPILGKVSVEIPAGMTHKQQIRTMGTVEDSDIVVDWGDGTRISIAKGEYDEYIAPEDEYNNSQVTVSHTYNKTGSYTVRIYGRKYYGLRTVSSESNTNLIYEAFSENCELARNVSNLSDFLRNADRLVNLSMSFGALKKVGNIYALCRNCRNLLTATGFPLLNGSCGYIFLDCINLVHTDFVLPDTVTTKSDGSLGRCFENCVNLEGTVESFLPPGGFVSYRVNINQLFKNAKKLTLGNYTNVNYILFGSTRNIFCGSSNLNSNTSTVFEGCSDELRAQVPASWGGYFEEFISSFKITLPEDNMTYKLTLENATGSTIEWGDGSVTSVTKAGSLAHSHVYAKAGTYTISTRGVMDRVVMGNNDANFGKYVTEVLTVSKHLKSFRNTFSYLENITSLPADFKIRDNISNCETTFRNCKSLVADVNDLVEFTSGSKIVNGLFQNCANITGTIDPAKWWNNTNITWTFNTYTFAGCSAAITNQVPKTWGGSLA